MQIINKKNMDQQHNLETEVPNQFLCPIFQQIMKDPVLTADGFCFERRAIQQWFQKGRNTNPLTNRNIGSTNLVQNRVLRNVIQLHNTRIRDIQRKAYDTAKDIIRQSNQTISQVFPQLIDDSGLVSLDKLVQVSGEVSNLRNILKSSTQKFGEVKKQSQKQIGPCRQCKNSSQAIKGYNKFLQKQVAQALKSKPLIEQRRIKKQQIPYLIVNSQCIKGIDFRRIKASDMTKYFFQGALISRLTSEEVISKIRLQRKIPPKDFVRIWITDMAVEDLYKHIVEQVESITGTYICKVKCVGKKIQNLKKKVVQLKMTEKEYWIVEHGPGEDFVFRNDQTKCDYCYKIKKVQSQCDCKKVFYCSKQCHSKDRSYHERVCKLIVGSAQSYLKA